MQPGCSRVITTSRRGRRLVYIFLFAISGLSTHDLTQRSTALYLYSASSFLLSTHDLTQRSTCSYSSVPHTIGPFNSRPHAEVDFVCCSYFYPLSPFNSRPHAEVDLQHGWKGCISNPFNSRPHAEVDLHFGTGYNNNTTFNSRPHAEVDNRPLNKPPIRNLSTHDLTQRSTCSLTTEP